MPARSAAFRHARRWPGGRRARHQHKETPGLGDYIEVKKDKNKARPWITQFTGMSLAGCRQGLEGQEGWRAHRLLRRRNRHPTRRSKAVFKAAKWAEGRRERIVCRNRSNPGAKMITREEFRPSPSNGIWKQNTSIVQISRPLPAAGRDHQRGQRHHAVAGHHHRHGAVRGRCCQHAQLHSRTKSASRSSSSLSPRWSPSSTCCSTPICTSFTWCSASSSR
jgi:hypothetical protein